MCSWRVLIADLPVERALDVAELLPGRDVGPVAARPEHGLLNVYLWANANKVEAVRT